MTVRTTVQRTSATRAAVGVAFGSVSGYATAMMCGDVLARIAVIGDSHPQLIFTQLTSGI